MTFNKLKEQMEAVFRDGETSVKLSEEFEDRYHDTEIAEEEYADVALFVNTHFDALVSLLRSPNHALRHSATFLLGYSKHAKSVAPLIDVLLNEKDMFDHDYAYEAMFQLGDVAHESLYELAIDGPEKQRFEAMQSLRLSDGDIRPWIRKILDSGSIPPGFFTVFEDMEDPAFLPDLELGLWSDDPRIRADALYAANELLEIAQGDPQYLSLINPEKWGDRFVALLNEGGDRDESSYALYSIGYLKDERHLDTILDVVNGPEEGLNYYGVEVLSTYQTEKPRALLLTLLDHDRLDIAALAGAYLNSDEGVNADHLEKACQVALRGLIAFHRDLDYSYVSSEIASYLPRSEKGLQMLIDIIEDETAPDTRYIAANALNSYKYEAYDQGMPSPGELLSPTALRYLDEVEEAEEAYWEQYLEDDEDE